MVLLFCNATRVAVRDRNLMQPYPHTLLVYILQVRRDILLMVDLGCLTFIVKIVESKTNCHKLN